MLTWPVAARPRTRSRGLPQKLQALACLAGMAASVAIGVVAAALVASTSPASPTQLPQM